MSERIQSFRDRASAIVSEEMKNRGELYESNEFNKRWDCVFAELLIRECISLLPEVCQSEDGCHASWTIKEHFGVKE